MKLEDGKNEKDVYHLRKLKQGNLYDAIYKWYVQERMMVVLARGANIQHAAQILATHLSIEYLKCNDG